MKPVLHTAVIWLTVLHLRGAPFQNLDFEMANPANLFTQRVEFIDLVYGCAEDLIPGWRVMRDEWEHRLVGFNTGVSLEGGPSVFDATAFSLAPPREGWRPPDGGFGFGMLGETPSTVTEDYISQRGDVPADARYLSFRQYTYSGAIAPRVNGEGLPFLAGNSVWSIWDISAHAGKEVELSFHWYSIGFPIGETAFMDSIVFDVPEPGAWSLALLGGAVLGLGRVARSRRR
jgi:hypothetical protein